MDEDVENLDERDLPEWVHEASYPGNCNWCGGKIEPGQLTVGDELEGSAVHVECM